MSAPLNLIEGWTGDLDFTLKADGSAINGTGTTPTLVLRDRNGGTVDMTGKVAWISAAAGTVRYSPAATDLKAQLSPYEARFKVTDASSKDVFFPNGAADVWTVRT